LPTGAVVEAEGEATAYELDPSITVPEARFKRLVPELTQTLAGVVGVDCHPVSAVEPKKFTSHPGAPAGVTALTPVTTLRYTPAVVLGMLMLTGPLYTMPADDVWTNPPTAAAAASADIAVKCLSRREHRDFFI
jgi:hypothetical protein